MKIINLKNYTREKDLEDGNINMKLWKQYVLDDRQFMANLILTIILSTITGFLIDVIYEKEAIFREIVPTILHFSITIIIYFQISPRLVAKYLGTRSKEK